MSLVLFFDCELRFQRRPVFSPPKERIRMSRLNELAENYRNDIITKDFYETSSALMREAFQESIIPGNYPQYVRDASEAVRVLTDAGVLPLLAFDYLNARDEDNGTSNFQDISDEEDDDGVIQRDELEEHLDLLENKGAVLSSELVRTMQSNFDAVEGLDGLAGISEYDYQRFIEQGLTTLRNTGVPLAAPPVTPPAVPRFSTSDPVYPSTPFNPTNPFSSMPVGSPASYVVQSGEGFDVIARNVFRSVFSERPSRAVELALSKRIAELNHNDREYGGGYIHPGQILNSLSEAELRSFVASLPS
jgi:hypothetical protein